MSKYNEPLTNALQNGHALATISDYYASCLEDNKPANAFLRRRELHRSESLESLRLGFSDRTLGKQLPPKIIKAGRELRDKLKSLHILKSTGHETLRGCLTAPLTDLEGNVTGLYGRRIDDHTKGELHYRLGCGIFNVTALSKFDELILTDSILNALKFHAAGHDNVIALQGIELTSEILTNVKRLLLAHPNTDDGNAAVKRIAGTARSRSTYRT